MRTLFAIICAALLSVCAVSFTWAADMKDDMNGGAMQKPMMDDTMTDQDMMEEGTMMDDGMMEDEMMQDQMMDDSMQDTMDQGMGAGMEKDKGSMKGSGY